MRIAGMWLMLPNIAYPEVCVSTVEKTNGWLWLPTGSTPINNVFFQPALVLDLRQDIDAKMMHLHLDLLGN